MWIQRNGGCLVLLPAFTGRFCFQCCSDEGGNTNRSNGAACFDRCGNVFVGKANVPESKRQYFSDISPFFRKTLGQHTCLSLFVLSSPDPPGSSAQKIEVPGGFQEKNKIPSPGGKTEGFTVHTLRVCCRGAVPRGRAAFDNGCIYCGETCVLAKNAFSSRKESHDERRASDIN